MKYNVFLSLFFMTFTLKAYAADTVIGGWKGSALIEELPVVVEINIDSLTPGEKALTLSFGRPRLCKADADYAGKVSNTHIFYFSTASSSTWCQKNLRPGTGKTPLIKLNLTESGKLNYELFINKKRLEGGGMKRYK